MWSSVIAVIGTLAGGLLTGLLQSRVGRAARREEQAAARRKTHLDAITALVEALADYRRTMWMREDWRLIDAPDDKRQQARAATHAARSAISAPLTTVQILMPELAPHAREAARAAYALRHAPDHRELSARREAAMIASDRLVEAATAHLSYS